MSSGLMLSLVILAVLVASLWFIIDAEGGINKIPTLLERVGIHVSIPDIPTITLPRFSPKPKESTSSIPPEYQSGSSRYSNGTCETAADCVTAGCSGEVCSNNPNVTTTCEFSPTFPNARGYSCGCLPTGFCGWENKESIYD